MTKKCVFCGTEDNLTVSMQVTTDKGSQAIDVCAEHEDDASPKKVRELVAKKEEALAELERQAKELGYELAPTGGSGIVAVTKKDPEPKPKSTGGEPPQKVSSSKTPAKPRKMKMRQVQAPGTGASYDTAKAEAPGVLEVEEQVVATDGGRQLTVPKKIESEAGTTEIVIADTDDKMIQRNMNKLKDKANRDGMLFQQGYMASECTLCKGTGITAINGQKCIRCGGTGTS
jgi:hypothetical protein